MQTNKTLRCIAAMCVFSMILAISACDKPKPGAGPGGPGPHGKGPMPPPEVSVVEVKIEKAVFNTELSGRVSAYLVADVRPQVSGIIQKVNFKEGSVVKEGQVLYQIDPALFKAAHDSAKAALVKAEANVPPSKSKAMRYKDLVAAKAISQQEYDDADAALKKAEADVVSAKADEEKARINLAYTSIKAPISGRIGKSSVTTGALVTAFQPAELATIQKLDPVYVDVTQSSTSLLSLRKKLESGLIKKDAANQAKVKLVLEDGTPYPQEGALKFSDVTVEPGTGSVVLRSVFPNPKQTLLPGMFVRTLVEEGINENAILIPQQCVTRNPKGAAVAMIVDGEGKMGVRELTIDRAVGNKWVISNGLKPGDKVVVEGVMKAKPGDPVKTVPYEPGKEGAGAPKPMAAEPPKSDKPASGDSGLKPNDSKAPASATAPAEKKAETKADTK